MKKNWVLCIDIGGTKIHYGLVNIKGQILNTNRAITETKTESAFLEQLKEIIKESYSPKVSAISVSFAGPVDPFSGVILKAPHFPSFRKSLPLKKIMSSWVKIPVFVEHDGFCFTLGESVFGEAKNYRYVVGLTLGTGVGSGIVLNKKIYRGGSFGVELGHMKINENGPVCSCHKTGHLESYVSGKAMVKFYKGLTGLNKNSFEIARLAKQGDKRAKKSVATMGKYLGLGLANLANILNPEIIVIGGGLSRVKMLFPPALQTMKNEAIYSNFQKIKVVRSKMPDQALLLGAALITQKKYRSEI